MVIAEHGQDQADVRAVRHGVERGGGDAAQTVDHLHIYTGIHHGLAQHGVECVLTAEAAGGDTGQQHDGDHYQNVGVQGAVGEGSGQRTEGRRFADHTGETEHAAGCHNVGNDELSAGLNGLPHARAAIGLSAQQVQKNGGQHGGVHHGLGGVDLEADDQHEAESDQENNGEEGSPKTGEIILFTQLDRTLVRHGLVADTLLPGILYQIQQEEHIEQHGKHAGGNTDQRRGIQVDAQRCGADQVIQRGAAGQHVLRQDHRAGHGGHGDVTGQVCGAHHAEGDIGHQHIQ